MTRIDCSEKGMVELGGFASLNTGTRIEAEESVVLGKYVTTGDMSPKKVTLHQSLLQCYPTRYG